MTKTAIRVEGLSHWYGERHVLKGIDLEIQAAEIFGILGPNGGGKTTFFRILSTFFPLTHGKVTIGGVDLGSKPQDVRRQIGVVFQHPSLDKRLTVRENLWHQGHLFGLSGQELSRRIEKNLERLYLKDREKDLVGTLSGGLQRRVEIAKGLLHSPKILLLDEPSTGLDPGARRELWKILEELRDQEGVCVVLTTHIMEEAEGCNRVSILHHGKVIALGKPEELKSEIQGEVILLDTENPARLSELIRLRFGTSGTVLEESVRIEHTGGHQFLSKLFDAFPAEIRAVTLRKPTLEDIFVMKTGDQFWKEEGRDAA